MLRAEALDKTTID